MVLLSVSTPSSLSFFHQDSSRPYELPSPVDLPALDGPVHKTAFSKTGAFAAATEAGSVYVWEDTSRPNKVLQVVKGLKHDQKITALLLDSLDGLTVIFAQGYKVHLHDARTSQRITTFENFPSVVNDISLSLDSQLIATGHESGQASVWNRQHSTHTNITLHPRSPILLAQMHPTKRHQLLIIPGSSPARLIVYDTLKTSSPLKVVELCKASNPAIPTAMAFHQSNSHVAVVSNAGDLWTVNLESWSLRPAQIRVPLTSVVWAGKTTVAVGTETGRLLMRDVASKTEEGSGVVLSEEADPVLSLSAQPIMAGSSSSRRRAMAESSSANETNLSVAPSTSEKSERTSSSRRSSRAPSDLPAITTSVSDSRRSHTTIASSSGSSAAYRASPSPAAHGSSYQSLSDSAPLPRASRTEPSRSSSSTSTTAARAKRVIWGDETKDDQPRRRDDESPSGRTVSPGSATTSVTRRTSPPRPTSAERVESASSSSSSPTRRAPASGSATSYRSSSPRSETHAARQGSQQEFTEDRDSPLIYAMSAQIRDLHLDTLRQRRQTKLEIRALFKHYFAESNDLRARVERLEAENARLRRGY